MAQLMSALAIGLFLAAAATDLAWRRIPNVFALGLAGLGMVRIALAEVAGADTGALAADALGAAALFVLGALAFRFGLLGGGDVKLLAAAALWLGAADLYHFLFVTALAGGVLALGFLVRMRLPGPGGGRRPPVSLPYGVAIAAGGVLATAAGL